MTVLRKRTLRDLLTTSRNSPSRVTLDEFVGDTQGRVQTAWDDLRFPATVLRRNNPNQEHPQFDEDVPGLLFRHTDTDQVLIIAQMPHAWARTDLQPHVHWTKTADGEGSVQWELSYRWAAIGQLIEDWVSIESTPTPVSDQDQANRHAISGFPAISAAGKKDSDMLLMRLRRLHDHENDTASQSIRLMEFDIHYQIDSFGSVNPFGDG